MKMDSELEQYKQAIEAFKKLNRCRIGLNILMNNILLDIEAIENALETKNYDVGINMHFTDIWKILDLTDFYENRS